MKSIYYEPASRLHSIDRELILYPPEGYRFVRGDGGWERATGWVTENSYLHFFFSRFVIDALVPVSLTKAFLEGFFRQPPPGVHLTYARNHLIFRPEPWIVHVEWVHVLAGFNIRHFYAYRKTIERILSSTHCKKILTWGELAREAILRNLDCNGFEHKLQILPLAVRPKNFTKRHNDDTVKLLFISSGNMPDRVPGAPNLATTYNFHAKGGKEVLAAFDILSRRYPNLKLVIRAPVPSWVKRRYQGMSNMQIIDRYVPWEVLEQEFQSADIFLFPAHHTPWQVMLDAMSYELPVVTTDVHANAELVTDGLTGFVVRGAQKVRYWWKDLIPAGASPLQREFLQAIEHTHEDVVEQLVEKTRVLIENPELRRSMGRAGRHEVEEGKFSIRRRNEILKSIFDDVTETYRDRGAH